MTTQPLLGPEWATVTEHEIEATVDSVFAPLSVSDDQLAFDFFDYDAEAEDYEEWIADQDFWRMGQW